MSPLLSCLLCVDTTLIHSLSYMNFYIFVIHMSVLNGFEKSSENDQLQGLKWKCMKKQLMSKEKPSGRLKNYCSRSLDQLQNITRKSDSLEEKYKKHFKNTPFHQRSSLSGQHLLLRK